MSYLTTDSRSMWNSLDQEWRQAHAKWHDQTTEYFAANYWQPLERDVADFLHTLEALEKVLQEIEML